jgi:ABC-2 type transport system permease protein
MKKFLVIFKREYAQVVKKKSFIVGIFLTPVLMSAFMLLPGLLATSGPSSAEHLVIVDRGLDGIGESFAESLDMYTIGEDSIPAYNVDKMFVLAPEDTATFDRVYDSLKTAVSNKDLKYFVVIGPDATLADTNLYLVTNSDNFRSINRFERRLTDIVSSLRLESSSVNLPVDSVLVLTKRIDLPIKDTKGESIPFQTKYFAALILVMLIYTMIITYGTLLMRSVIEEKSSRIMEVLVSSVSPFQLMLGKVCGLGAAAFTTVLIWVVLGGVLFAFSGAAAIDIDPAVMRVVFNPVIVTFFVLFLTSGYLLYSTFFAVIGSIVNNDKESQNFIFPIVIFLLVPVFVGIGVVQDPYVMWARVLSFIPLFAPTLMLMRVSFIAPTATEYSLFSGIVGEATISFIIVVLSILGMVWLAGRIFRVGILMYGKRPTLPELVKWIGHK